MGNTHAALSDGTTEADTGLESVGPFTDTVPTDGLDDSVRPAPVEVEPMALDDDMRAEFEAWEALSGEAYGVRTFTAYVEWDPDTNLYVGIVPGIPGAHTQAATLDELRENLKEVLQLCLQEYEGSLDEIPRFVRLQQVEVAV